MYSRHLQPYTIKLAPNTHLCLTKTWSSSSPNALRLRELYAHLEAH